MRLYDANWEQVEAYLRRDDRVVLPVARRSSTPTSRPEPTRSSPSASPSRLPRRSACSRCRQCRSGSPPASPCSPARSRSSRDAGRVLTGVLETLYGQGFRGFRVVNGHGGNVPVAGRSTSGREGARRRGSGSTAGGIPRPVRGAAEAIDPEAAHARGSRTSRGPGWPASSCPRGRSLRSPTRRRCESSTPSPSGRDRRRHLRRPVRRPRRRLAVWEAGVADVSADRDAERPVAASKRADPRRADKAGAAHNDAGASPVLGKGLDRETGFPRCSERSASHQGGALCVQRPPTIVATTCTSGSSSAGIASGSRSSTTRSAR